MTSEELVEGCLELAGYVPVSPSRRQELVDHVRSGGDVRCDTPEEQEAFGHRVTRLLQLIVSSREYQFA
jgi:hypothetical protein